MLFSALLFIWKQEFVNIWEHTTLGDLCHVKHLSQFGIASQSKIDMLWSNGLILVLKTHLAGQFTKLFNEVLEDSCHVHSGRVTLSHSVSALSQKSVASSWCKYQAGFGCSGDDGATFLSSSDFLHFLS